MLLRVLALLAIPSPRRGPWRAGSARVTRRRRIAIVIDNSLSSSAVVNGRPLLDQFKRWRATSLSQRDADRSPLAGRRSTAACAAARPALLRDEIDRLEPIAGAGDPGRRRSRARPASCAQRVSTRSKSRCSPTGNAASGSARRRSPTRSCSSYVPTTRAAGQSRGDARRGAARSLDAARLRRGALSVARLDDLPHHARTDARSRAARRRRTRKSSCARRRPSAAGSPAPSSSSPTSCRATTCATSRCGSGRRPASASSPSAGPFVKSAFDVLRTSERVVDGHDISVVGGRRAVVAARADHRAARSRATGRGQSRARASRNSVAIRRAADR